MLFKAHKEAIEHLKLDRDNLRKELDAREIQIKEMQNKLREIAKIAFQTGGIKGHSKLQQIKHIVFDWKEK
jgi:hypothetical protein